MTVRRARLEDAGALGRLFRGLGYPDADDGLAQRLDELRADPRSAVLVATGDDGEAVGVATVALVPVAHDPAPWSRITALVVHPASRRHGVGRALVAAAEDVARRAGASRLEVTSAARREDAHRFYLACGFAPGSAHFLKRLPAGRAR